MSELGRLLLATCFACEMPTLCFGSAFSAFYLKSFPHHILPRVFRQKILSVYVNPRYMRKKFRRKIFQIVT